MALLEGLKDSVELHDVEMCANLLYELPEFTQLHMQRPVAKSYVPIGHNIVEGQYDCLVSPSPPENGGQWRCGEQILDDATQ
jgi:hypothetical protein